VRGEFKLKKKLMVMAAALIALLPTISLAESPLEELGPIYVQSSDSVIQRSVSFDIAVACGQLATSPSNADALLGVEPIVTFHESLGGPFSQAQVVVSLTRSGSILWTAKSVLWSFNAGDRREALDNLTTGVGQGVMKQFEAKYPGCQEQRLPANVKIYVTPGVHPDGNISDESSPVVADQLKKDGFNVVTSAAEADLLLEYKAISTTTVFVAEDYKVDCDSDANGGECSDNEGNYSTWTSSSDGSNYSSSTTVSDADADDPGPGHYETVPLAYGWRLLVRQGPGNPLMFVTSKQLDISEVEQVLRKKIDSRLMLPDPPPTEVVVSAPKLPGISTDGGGQ
jgi:hypothetical protein